ncbi:MAG: TldD/PmbA family protein, partial [Actinomycetota bacterium]
DDALEEARRLGASSAEAFYQRGTGLTVKVFDGAVEKFTHSEGEGLGLRVWKGDSHGRSYTSDLSESAAREAVRAAVEALAVSPEDPHRALPDPSLFPTGSGSGEYLGADLELVGPDLSRTSNEEKIEFALSMERLAREFDPRVRGVEVAAYSDSVDEVLLANTSGFHSGFRSTECYGYLVAIADGEGDSQTGFGFTAARSFSDLDAPAAAEEAAAMAVDLLGARQVPTARVPVIINNINTAELLAALAVALSGEAVAKSRSFLAGRLGAGIASERVNLVDDGQMPGGFGSAPFDGEGVASHRTPVIEDGVLSTYLHNCYTASRLGFSTTANAGRASFRASIGVQPTNIRMEPGDADREALRSGMGTGLEVLELQGAHAGLNPVTGEVSLGARGLWVEKGRVVHPVREVTIAGTIGEILEGVAGIGSDLRFTPLVGSVGTASVLVEGLTVSGK